MLDFAGLKTALKRGVDDSSISDTNQGIYVNIGYKQVRKDIAKAKPELFESVKTTVTITTGLGDLPTDYMLMREVLDSSGNHLTKKARNLIHDDETGSTPLYWYLKRRKTSTTFNQQIGVRPVMASGSIYIHYIADAEDLDGTGDMVDLPDDEAQRIGLLYSAYEYYKDKRRWSDANNSLTLYTAKLNEHLETFDDEEEEMIEEEDRVSGGFTFAN